MLIKEVGSSGQISLGKKLAGQLFDLHFHDDGRIELLPVKVTPLTKTDKSATEQWVQAHSADIDAYNAWAEQRQPYSQRVRQWRAKQK